MVVAASRHGVFFFRGALSLSHFREVLVKSGMAPLQAVGHQTLRLCFEKLASRRIGKTMPLQVERITHALDQASALAWFLQVSNPLDIVGKDASGAVTWTEFIAAALCVSVCRNRREEWE